MKSRGGNRRGQVTIFIIVGIILVSIIAVFFLFRSGVQIPGIGGGTDKNPNSFLGSCLEDEIKEGVNLLSAQGGYADPTLYKSFKFDDDKAPSKIAYLCYSQADYVACVPQEPMLIQHLKEELKNYISNNVKSCFDSLASSFEKQGYSTDAVYRGFDIELEEKKIIFNIDAEVTLTKSGETTKQENFEAVILSRFYDLTNVAQEIVNKESTNCEFNQYDSFSYPDFDITKYRTADSSVIYRIINKDSSEEFRLAVRGCIMPPGFGIEK